MSLMTETPNPVHETYFRPFDFKITDGSRAYVDAHGTFRTAFDEVADSVHNKVSLDWRARCIPALPLFQRVYDAAKHNVDIKTPESNVRITDDLTLPDGTRFTPAGLRSLMFFAGLPIKMQDWLSIYNYVPDLARYCNESLDRRELDWADKGKSPREFLVRMRKDENGTQVVRAVLSGKYGCFDNHEACAMVENALGNMDDVLVTHGWTSQDHLTLDLILPDAMKDDPNSQWGVGFSFSNNEIGSGAFNVEPYVFRSISRTGYRFGGFSTIVSVEQRHIGKIDHTKLQENVKKAIDIALTEGRSMLRLLNMAQSIRLTTPDVVIAGLSKEGKFTQDDIELVARNYVRGQKDPRTNGTAFGIVEAIALTASEQNGDRRTALEASAGRLVAPKLTSSVADVERHWSDIANTAARKVDENVLQKVRDIFDGKS